MILFGRQYEVLSQLLIFGSTCRLESYLSETNRRSLVLPKSSLFTIRHPHPTPIIDKSETEPIRQESERQGFPSVVYKNGKNRDQFDWVSLAGDITTCVCSQWGMPEECTRTWHGCRYAFHDPHSLYSRLSRHWRVEPARRQLTL